MEWIGRAPPALVVRKCVEDGWIDMGDGRREMDHGLELYLIHTVQGM